jgi:hypothetical protein
MSFSGYDPEQDPYEAGLGLHVIGRHSGNLPLADHRHSLIASNRLRSRHKALEAQSGSNQPFDAPVILLDDVVQELHLSEFSKAPECSPPLHGIHRNGIGGVLVDRDGSRIDCMGLTQSLPKEPPSSRGIPLRREQKINRLSGRINGTVQINPLALLEYMPHQRATSRSSDAGVGECASQTLERRPGSSETRWCDPPARHDRPACVQDHGG